MKRSTRDKHWKTGWFLHLVWVIGQAVVITHPTTSLPDSADWSDIGMEGAVQVKKGDMMISPSVVLL